MKYIKLLTIVATCLLVTSIFTVIPAFSAQPPVDQSTYYIAVTGQAKNLDPARAYDTASGEIIQNCYQTLIWYGSRNTLNFTANVGLNIAADPTNTLSDLSVFNPVIATTVPTIGNGGIYTYPNGSQLWTFTINLNAQFPSWIEGDGVTVHPAQNVTPADVVYSFQRQIIYDSSAAPTWMWLQTAFNPNWWSLSSGFPHTSYANGTFKTSATEDAVSALIQQWCWYNDSTHVYFHFEYPYPPTPMYQIFAQTWGSILEKDWVIAHGGWTGSFAHGWSNNWRRKPSNDYSELDVPAPLSTYPTNNPDVPNMLGTGPYMFTSWNKATGVWRIDWNPNFWMGWTNAGDGSGHFLHTIIESVVASWPTRKMLFLNGEEDVVAVPRSNMYDLLATPGDAYDPLPGINMDYNVPELETDEMFFVTNVSATATYQSYVGNPHIESDPTFFNDQNIRLAFAWSLNYTEYFKDAWFDEAIQQTSWWCTGLTPIYNATFSGLNTNLVQRNENLTLMKYYLDQAALIDGNNVSNVGFDVTFLYDTGDTPRQIACQAIANSWTTLGSKYHVSVIPIDWPTYLTYMVSYGMGSYILGWLADFADAVDFAGVYMGTGGSFSGFQGPPYPADQSIIDTEIAKAATEPDVYNRCLEYQDLEARYYNDAMSVALEQPTGRGWQRDWVQNRWVNQLLPGVFAYYLYKSSPAVIGSVTLDVQHTLTKIVTYTQIYVFDGAMTVGGGVSSDLITPMQYNVEVTRTDGNIGTGLVYVTLGLYRTPGEGNATEQYGNGTYLLIGAGQSLNRTFTWLEDGVAEFITANDTGITYTVGASSYPFQPGINDTDPSLEIVTNGTFVAKTLTADINGDGTVDIYDALGLSAAFGSSTGGTNYSTAADLNLDGTVDIYDAIILAGHFGQTIGTS